MGSKLYQNTRKKLQILETLGIVAVCGHVITAAWHMLRDTTLAVLLH